MRARKQSLEEKMKRSVLAIVFSVMVFSYATANEKPSNETVAGEEVMDDNIKIAGHSPVVSPTKNAQAMEAYNRGTQLLHENKLDEAEKYLTEAITLDPLFVDAMDHLGLVYRRQRRYDDAEAIYLKSIETNKNNTVPYQNLAIVYSLQNKLNDALEQYKKMIEIDPENPESYYGIGELFYMVRDHETSIMFFDEAIKKYAAQSSTLGFDALTYQGMNYYQLKKYDEAFECLEKVQKVNPNDEKINKLINEIRRLRLGTR
jgi:tetratricopeptide (TPR) repeat protein